MFRKFERWGEHEDTGSKSEGKGVGGEKYFRIIEGGTDSENPEG